MLQCEPFSHELQDLWIYRFLCGYVLFQYFVRVPFMQSFSQDLFEQSVPKLKPVTLSHVFLGLIVHRVRVLYAIW